MHSDDLVDLTGIQKLLGVAKHTPNQWRNRGVLPPPDFPEMARPVWKRETIIIWAAKTGRLPATLLAEARRLNRSSSSDIQADNTREDSNETPAKAGIPAALFIAPELDDQGLIA